MINIILTASQGEGEEVTFCWWLRVLAWSSVSGKAATMPGSSQVLLPDSLHTSPSFRTFHSFHSRLEPLRTSENYFRKEGSWEPKRECWVKKNPCIVIGNCEVGRRCLDRSPFSYHCIRQGCDGGHFGWLWGLFQSYLQKPWGYWRLLQYHLQTVSERLPGWRKEFHYVLQTAVCRQLEAWSLGMGQAVLEFSKSMILGSGLRTFTNMSPGNSQSLGCFLSYHCGFLCHDWLFPIWWLSFERLQNL